MPGLTGRKKPRRPDRRSNPTTWSSASVVGTGDTCDIANNGDEALTALQQNRYDLVLMDCQMPEMDGFTATREIRRREAAGELPGHRPIIALTANALKGDRERCLEAGMEDYLSKPLQSAQLQSMLAKFLSPKLEGALRPA